MATLVLTTVGTMIGGPVGGSIGALIGQAVDARIFAPKGRQGPRLSDLRVQTSSYGTPIPRLYGRMRVAGTVIWSTDLVEHRQRQGGKGRAATTTYSYSASFAVALSSRPVRSVGRIWAEGNILRGAAGDFKSATGFTLHGGDEDQPVDPLIAAAEGASGCPAFRGIAYALFEDMDLSPFGNRIPSLTFEVEAEDGVAAGTALSLAGPMADVLADGMAVAATPVIEGAAFSAASRRDAIEALARLAPVDRAAGAALWRIGEAANEAAIDLAEAASERAGQRPSRTLGDGGAVPRQVNLTLFDPARDFQTAVHQARVPGGLGPVEAMALPLAIEAGVAKALTGRLARDSVREVRRCDWPAGFAGLAAVPGARVVTGDGTAGRVAERRIEGAGVRLIIERERSLDGPAAEADGGRVLGSPDLRKGASRGWLFDLPLIDGTGRQDDSRLVLAAGGEGPGWRQAAVSVATSVGAAPASLGSVRAMAVLGEVISIEGAGQPWLFDRAGAIIVELLHEAMQLANADDGAMLGGANLAAAGDEIIQFGHAQPLGARRWRLTQLLRGRWGTEDAMADPAAGRGFALIDDPALMPLPGTMQPGGSVMIEGQDDAVPLMLEVSRAGRAGRPLSPVALRAAVLADGALMIRWTRRSRLGAGWDDWVDVPPDESGEHYAVTLVPPGSATVEVVCDGPMLLIEAATVSGWRTAGGVGSSVAVAIRQIGARGPSPALNGTAPL